MDLHKRLARLDRLTRKDPSSEPDRPGPAAVRGGGADDGDVQRVLIEALALESATTAAGVYWWRESVHPESPPPNVPVPDLSGILTAGTPPALDWDKVLFLDTETTGLAGGTGTLPFLVGLAWWENSQFRVRQLFLSGPGREAALIDAIADLAQRFRVVATYNGASFDLPLVRTRALLARTEDPCAHLVNWDLLVATRRLWGRQLPDCRQQTIERHLSGGDRGPGDIDGALIPATYMNFLHDRDPGLLPEVLRHNRRDMTGMARILSAVAAAATAVTAETSGWGGLWQEAWGRALIGERRRDRTLAAAWARHLAEPVVAEDVTLPACLDAVRLLKRVADWPRVAAILENALSRWPDDRRLHYEAAVIHEHRLGDLARALVHAEVLAEPRRLDRLRRRLARD